MHKILLVDDDRVFLETMRELFTQYQCPIETAVDCDQAINILSKGIINVLITDILIPGQDGLALISKVRILYPQVKIVAISGGGKIDKKTYLRLAKELRADAVLEKPFVWDELKAILDGLNA